MFLLFCRGMGAQNKSLKPGIALIGAGNLAGALAVSLRAAGYTIVTIVLSGNSASARRGRALARQVGASVTSLEGAHLSCDVVWFCVPDAAIASAATTLAKVGNWKDKIALHSSGASTSDELTVLRRQGASVASAHPLMTFVTKSRPTFRKVPFAVEGDRSAVRMARRIVRDLGGESFSIRKRHKPLYHAWGMFASPLLTALLASAERVALAAAIGRKAARARMLPILKQTLDNYAQLGPAASFSGPIARGDVVTVKKHLDVLKGEGGAREIYVALAKAALRDLPAKKRSALAKLLES